MARRPALRPTLSFCELRLVYVSDVELTLPPIAATTLRGALGNALRRELCITGAPTCDRCSVRDACAFGRTWEPLRRVREGTTNETPPYVFDAPVGSERHVYAPGTPLAFCVRLFGTARQHVSHWVNAAVGAGHTGLGPPSARVEAELVQADVIWGEDDAWMRVFDNGIMLPPPPPASACTLLGPPPAAEGKTFDRVVVEVRTPLWLRERRARNNGKRAIDTSPTAATLTAAIARRISGLAQGHEGVRTRWDGRQETRSVERSPLVRAEIERVLEERYSQRTNRSVPVDGFVGTLEYAAVPQKVVDLWSLAGVTGVGKNANLGFGQLAVHVADRE